MMTLVTTVSQWIGVKCHPSINIKLDREYTRLQVLTVNRLFSLVYLGYLEMGFGSGGGT